MLGNERPHAPEQSHEAEWPHEPEVWTHSQDIQNNPPQAPCVEVVHELRSVQHTSCVDMWTTKDASGSSRQQHGHESYCCGPGGPLEMTIYD